MMGVISEWSYDHGAIKPDCGGPEVYVSAADLSRVVRPRVGLRVSFEVVPEKLPDEQSMARACLVVLAGGKANG